MSGIRRIVRPARYSASSLPRSECFHWLAYAVLITLWAINIPSTRAALPVITSQPQSWVATVGDNHTFQAAATGTAPLHFQWFHDGSALGGATSASLNLTGIQTNQAGLYFVTVTNLEGAATSVVARLTVRLPGDPKYAEPGGGWDYLYSGEGVDNDDFAALDGTWNHFNGSDSWSGDGRGPGVGLLGGVGTTNGILTLEDDLTSGASSVDNRRYYFTHDLSQDPAVIAPNTILDDGITLSFRARLTPPPPTDPLTELTNAPNGFVNVSDGKGMVGVRQSGGGGMIISFSLHQPIEEQSSVASFNFGQAGLHMNGLNGDDRSPNVDPGEGGTLNLLPLDPTVFHEFWITIKGNGASPGTHQVSIYLDGNETPTVFQVTGGTGSDTPSADYLALGLGSTFQRAAFDVDFLAYKAGVAAPAGFNEPAAITQQPVSQLVAVGESASFQVQATGTPPLRFQWYRDQVALPNATNAIYFTPPTQMSDDGSQFVVVVANDLNSVTSAPPATLEVVTPPAITAQPQSLTVTNGDNVMFSVTATGEFDLTYQWSWNGEDLPDATNATLLLPLVQPGQAGSYVVAVSNPGGTTLSDPAVLTVRVQDFGDAPDSAYPTRRDQNGPRHLLVEGVYLGQSADYEMDALPNAQATGDDLNNIDDEDGVTFPGNWRIGQPASVQVVAAAAGRLNAWIDFNQDGSWSQTGEQIFTNTLLSAGANSLSLLIPSSAKGGMTFARFRYNTTGNLGITGPAADGEVEDYQLTLTPVTDLALAILASPNPVAVGSNLTVQLTAHNLGPSAASGVTVSYLLPASFSYVDAQSTQGSCQFAGGTINCLLGSLNSTGQATVTVNLLATAAGSPTHQTTISGNELDLVSANNTASVVTTVRQPPVITTQPQDQTVAQGTTATFQVTASGATPLFYQWRFKQSILPNQTNATLKLSNVQPAQEGAYDVRVSNDVGAVFSSPVTLTVIIPPAIMTQPASRTNLAGGTASFVVTATGSEPLHYQWFFNDVTPLSNATNATLTLSNLQLSQAGTYRVEISNDANTVLSNPAQLTVIEMDFGDAPDPNFPTLLANNGARHRLVPGIRLGATVDFEPDGAPASDAAGDDLAGVDDEDGVTFSTPLQAGQPYTLTVQASTNGLLDAWIDWNHDETWSEVGERLFNAQPLVAGANVFSRTVPANAAPALSVARFRFSTIGGLPVNGEAANGEVEDYQINIRPTSDLRVTQSAAPNPIAVGSNLVYSIIVTNAGPSPAPTVALTNQLPAGVSFSSATPSQGSCENTIDRIICQLGEIPPGSPVAIQITVAPLMPGSLTNRVNVGSIALDLNPANNQAQTVVDALLHPAITAPPQSLTVIQNDTAVFNVTAVGTNLRYQWQQDGADLPNQTNANLTLPNAQTINAGSYVVRVSNSVGTVFSPPAILTVVVPVSITGQPQSRTNVVGQTASFSVTASGSSPLTYQWRFAGNDLPNQTNADLMLPNVQANQAGLYDVFVANAAGGIFSAAARLTVIVPPSITTQPLSRTNLAGTTASFTVLATGTAPLAYRWFFNGTTPLPQGTNASLVLNNVQTSQSGLYSAVVTNAGGTITSESARLTVLEMDFGDTPDPSYPTLLTFNGARHILKPGVYLGSGADYETDAWTSPNASGDDTHGTDDEDGVRFSSVLRVGQLVPITVTASTNGLLDAWIDYNGNGQWIDPGEQVFTSQPLVAGPNALQLQVPASITPINSFARFRFSTSGGLSFTGLAEDGEVEDYAVIIDPAVDLVAMQEVSADRLLVAGTITVNILVSNAGPSTASSVVLTNRVAPQFGTPNLTFSQGSCAFANGTILCNVGKLAPGAMASLSWTATATATGYVTNRIAASAQEYDVDPTNNGCDHPLAIVFPTVVRQNTAPLTMPDNNPAQPYPSTIFVSGLTATVYRVTATISNLSHTFPDDFDILLVGPQGQSVILMSDAGGNFAMSDVTITFDDDAEAFLPNTGLISNGQRYKPTNHGTGQDPFPAPAPDTLSGTNLNVFAGTDPNGVWSLYVLDDFPEDTGSVGNGWSLNITTIEPFADLSLHLTESADPIALSSNLVYTLSITNFGPSPASDVQLVDDLPAGLGMPVISSSQGVCGLANLKVICFLGDLPVDGHAIITITAPTTQLGQLTNRANVSSSTLDLVSPNNQREIVTEVTPIIDLALGQTVAPPVGLAGSNLVFTLHVTNRGPAQATSVRLMNPIPANATFVSALSSQGTCVLSNNLVDCALGNLNAGTTASMQLTLLPPQSGQFSNSATVSARQFDINAANNQNTLTVLVEDAPIISVIANQFTSEDTPTAPITFTVTDAISAPNTLVVSGSSSNPTLVPTSNLVFGGTGSNRTLVITPTLNQFGTSAITIRAQDPAGLIRATSFVLTVQSVNDAPTLDFIADVTVDEDASNQRVDLTGISSGVPNENQSLIVSASSSDPNLIATPIVLYTSPNPTGTLFFRPVANAHGTAVITVAVDDGGGINTPFTRQFTVTVNSINDPPTITAPADQSVDEDQSTPLLAFTVNDLETALVDLTLQGASSDPSVVPEANIQFGGTGTSRTVTVRPALNAFGSATITLRVTDGDNDARTAAFLLTVQPVNDPPTVDPIDELVLDEDSRLTVDLTGITAGAPNESQPITLSAISSNPSLLPNPTLNYQTPNVAGTMALVPATNANGTVTITLTARDDGTTNHTLVRAIPITIRPVNDLPEISKIANLTTLEDTTSTENPFVVGDLETSANNLTPSALSSHPQLVPVENIFFGGNGSNRTVRALPATNQFGTATITVQITDPEGGTSSQSFDLTVQPVNDPPVILNLADQTAQEDTLFTLPLTLWDPETNLAGILVTAVSTDQTLVPNSRLNLTGSTTNWTLNLFPTTNAFGTTTVTLTTEDALGARGSQSFQLSILPANDPPAIAPIASQIIAESSGSHSVPLSGIQAGPANEIQSMTVTALSSNPSLIPNPTILYTSPERTGTLTFTPARGRHGTALVTVTVNDGQAANATASSQFEITVTPVNDAPVVTRIADQTVPEDTTLGPLSFIAFDEDSPVTSLSISASSSNTNLISDEAIVLEGVFTNRTLTLQPKPNESGTALITLRVTDPEGFPAATSFQVEVLPVNDAPTLDIIPDVNLPENSPAFEVPLSGISSGAENENQSLIVTAVSEDSRLLSSIQVHYDSPQTNGSLTIVPQANASGSANVSVSLNDGGDGANTLVRTFLVTLQPINDPPSITDIPDQFIEEDQSTEPITFLVYDAETPMDNLVLTVTSSNQALLPDSNLHLGGNGANRTLSIITIPNLAGTATVTVTVQDADGSRTNDTFQVRINSRNDFPTIAAPANQVISEDTATGLLAFTVADEETPAGNLQVGASSSNQILIPDSGLLLGGTGGNRTLRVFPATNQFGSAIITLSATDTDGRRALASFTVTVNPVNDRPFLTDIPNQSMEADTTLFLALSVQDPETAASALNLTASSSNQGLLPNGGLAISSSGASRTLAVTPTRGQTGNATVTLQLNDGTGGNASDTFLLTVTPKTITPASIVTQPQSQTVSNGQTATFSVTAAGSAPLFYQWEFKGTMLTGQTNANLVRNNAQPTDAGDYRVRVSNAVGSVLSQAATLTVLTSTGGNLVLSSITARSTAEDTPITVPFTVGTSDAAALTVTLGGTSSNPGLIAATNILFNGSGTNRTVTLIPSPDQSGTATITIRATNQTQTASTAFNLTVNAVNDPPTLDQPPDLIVIEGPTTFNASLSGITSGAPNESQTLSISAVSSNPSVVDVQSVSYSSPATSGTITLKPSNNQTGVSIITVTVTDNQTANNLTTRTFNIYSRLSGNSLPTISSISNRAINEDTTTGAIAFTVSDAETATTTLFVSAQSSNPGLVPNGNIVLGGSGGNRTITVTPLAQQSGSTIISLRVTDTAFGAATTQFTLTVNPVNDQPFLGVVPNQTMSEDATLGPIPFTVSDVESPAGGVIVSVSSSDSLLFPAGAITLGGSGSDRALFLRPATNRFGVAMLTLTATDTQGASTNRAFSVTVNSVNDLPTISSIPDIVAVGGVSSSPLAFTIGDQETSASSLVISASSSNPSLIPNNNINLGGSGANRTVSVTPTGSQPGSALITVTVTDADLGVAGTVFNVTVNSVNNRPTLAAMGDLTLDEDFDMVTTILTGITDGSTNETQPLAVTAVSSNPSIVPHPVILYTNSQPTGLLLLQSLPNAHGTALITVTVNDGQPQNNTTSQSFNLTVRPINDAPTLSALPDLSILENASTGPLPFTVSDAETPAGSLPLTVDSTNPSLVTTGGLQLGGSGSNRTLTVTPSANQSGQTLITLRASDGTNNVSSSFVLEVRPRNELPTISNIPDQILPKNGSSGPLPFTIGDASTAANNLTVAVFSDNAALLPPSSLLLSGTGPNRSIAITPTADRSGQALITVVVSDEDGGTASESFLVTVASNNQPPTLSGLADLTLDEDQVSPVLLLAVQDAESAPSALQITVSSSNPALLPLTNIVVRGTGTVRELFLQSLANRFGTATVLVTVTDPDQGSSQDSFTVTVLPINDLPTVSAIPIQTTEPGVPTLAIPFTIDDVETPASALVVTASSSQPDLLPDANIILGGAGANRTIKLAPLTNAFGATIITLTVTDGQGGQQKGSFVLVTGSLNNPPTISSVSDQTIVMNQSAGPLSFVVSDVETPAGDLAMSAQSSSPSLVPPGNIVFGGTDSQRTVTLQPSADMSGSSLVTLIVTDAGGEIASASFWLTVEQPLTPSLIVRISWVDGETSLTFTTVAGLRYTVEYKDAIEGPGWSILTTVEGTGQALTVMDPNANAIKRFYRIRADIR